ncbi:MAG: hypothetical protein ABSC65_29235 [Acidobacteriaceae bacterium]
MASINPRWRGFGTASLRFFAPFLLLAWLTGLVSGPAWSQTSPQLPEYQFANAQVPGARP